MPYLLQLSLSCQGQRREVCAEGLRWMFSSIERVIREAPSPTQLKQKTILWDMGHRFASSSLGIRIGLESYHEYV
jgi:hypothetical protein